MTTLEDVRGLCEDLEVIEEAVAARFGRNPQLYYASGLPQLEALCGYKTRPGERLVRDNSVYREPRARQGRKQVAAQLLELRLFLDDYYKKQREIAMRVKELGHAPVPKLSQLASITSIPSSLQDKREEYAMFTAPQPSVLSKRAADLDVNKVFSREEQYGAYLDLAPLLGAWQSALRSPESGVLSLATHLQAFSDPETFLRRPVVDRKSPRYARLVKELAQYTQSFFHRRYPLIDRTVVESRLQRDFQAGYTDSPSGKRFCPACSKPVAASVYEAHSRGKPHQKHRSKHAEMLRHEYWLHRYVSQLQEEISATVALLERRQALTPQERATELADLDRAYREPTYTPQDDEETQEEETTPSTHVGPDGIPIPFWLYKLQGLDVSYPCEICGNAQYQGRRAFDRHFSGPKHQLRLRCLGIEPSPAFRGITAIDDALSLAKTAKSHSATALSAQAEDRSGNVLAQADYDDLRRQGLL